MRAVLDTTTFPDRLACFNDGNSSCLVTPSMLSFLNITTKEDYVEAYCLRPPSDSCAFDFCPNSDISGPTVRISTYIVNFCLAILILYSPEETTGAFYSQLVTVYSFMMTVIVSMQHRSITRLHATFALFTVASPLSIYILIYGFRSAWARKKNRNHRLATIVGKGHISNRVLVLAMLPIWITLIIFISLRTQGYHFSQQACDWRSRQTGLEFFYYNPISILSGSWWKPLLAIIPIVSLLIFWAIGIWLQRKIIWKRGRSKKYPGARLWRAINDNYPFLRFYTVVLLPFAFWCATLELGVRPADEKFQFTFGQIIPLFVSIPPLLSVVKLAPEVPPWFLDLTWIRYVSRRQNEPRRPRNKQHSLSSLTSNMDGLYFPERPTIMTYPDTPGSSKTTSPVLRSSPLPLHEKDSVHGSPPSSPDKAKHDDEVDYFIKKGDDYARVDNH